MAFKNDFEKNTYEICENYFNKNNVSIEHNYVISTEKTIVSFTGNPKKEVDVLTLDLPNNVKLLISCKDYSHNVPPLAVQEWGSIINILNRHSISSTYYGVIIASKGFSKGCESWAKVENLGLVPPYRGERNNYTEEVIFKMLQRVLQVFSNSINRNGEKALISNGDFYWMCYKVLSGL